MRKTVALRRALARILPPVLLLGAAWQPALAQDCEVKLGVAAPMTGGGSAWGIALRGGTEFEAAWHNANGGLPVGGKKCKVAVTTVDNQQTAAGAAAASNTLASQGIRLVIGPVSSPENTGWKPVGKRNNQLNFTTTFALDAIGPDFPLAFQNQPPPAAWGATALKVAADRFKLKTITLVAPNDQGGTDAGNALLKYYNEVGVKGNAPEWYQRGTVNFAPIVARLMMQAPDAIETGPMPPGEATILAKQLLEAGYKGVFGRMGTGAEQIVKGVGGVDKMTTIYWYEAVPIEEPGIAKMTEEYQRLMKSTVPENSLVFNAQMAAEQITRAITRSGTYEDIEKVAAALRSTPPESRYLGKGGWRGKTMYGSNQALAFPIGMGFIVNGKKEAVRPVVVPAE
jgi:branched-chain amino acid transport system substrate-binding protein